jgi:hypothetical protein
VSFFDEGDQPTRVSPRPARRARPRRPATAANAGASPPDRQTARVRQAVGLGVLALFLILVVFGVKGCLDSQASNALKDYNRNVTAVIKDSDTAVGQPFFQLMGNAASQSSQLQVQVNQLRASADDDVQRAKAFSVPGQMTAAQRNLELVLNLRAGAIRKIADAIPDALGRGATSDAAIARIAAQMEGFLASDVVYAQRVAPLIKQALDESGVKGQQISGSRFLVNLAWLSPSTVADRLGRGSTSASGTPTPGTHGHGLLSTSVGTNTLVPEAPGVVNRVPASPTLAFTIKFANQGTNDESNVKVTVRVSGGGKDITQTRTISQTKAGQQATVTIPLGQTPPVGQASTVTVTIGKVPGEQKLDNNRSSYTVIFTQ